MTTVLTTTMTLRIILSVRGSLAQGGSYAGSSTARGTSTHVISTNNGRPQPPHPASFGPTGSAFGVQSTGGNGVLNINGYAAERKGSLGGGAGGGAGGGIAGVGKEGHVIGTLGGDKGRGGGMRVRVVVGPACLRGKRVRRLGVLLRFLLLRMLPVDVDTKASRSRSIVRSITTDDNRSGRCWSTPPNRSQIRKSTLPTSFFRWFLSLPIFFQIFFALDAPCFFPSRPENYSTPSLSLVFFHFVGRSRCFSV